MSTAPPPPAESTIRAALEAHGQSHVLAFWDELSDAQRSGLLEQIAAIDLDGLAALREETGADGNSDDLEPAPCFRTDASNFDRPAAIDRGVELIRAGRIAAFTVAGGQGTRLGWNGPKGSYPATVNTGKPLFRCFAEQIRATQDRYDVTIPWYIMTSPINDAASRAFFLDNNCFGLERTNVFMFPQGVMPSLDARTGKLLLEAKDRIAVNPDGHGGSIRALRASGAIEDMRARGIEQISYFQVDNPLVRVVDPLFIGLHTGAGGSSSSGQMSSKMVAKAYPEEKVGVFCRRQGRTVVIEYSDLPDALATATDETGRLRYDAGSVALHLMSVAFVAELTDGSSSLPFHRAIKKAPYVDDAGARIEPDEPNAVKLETFVFDALAFADESIVLETERVEEFAPIKNAKGVDSPATSHQLQSDRAGRWLERCGVKVPRRDDGHVDARIEISPLTALDADDLREADLPDEIARGSDVVI